jgi:hypothetical protein
MLLTGTGAFIAGGVCAHRGVGASTSISEYCVVAVETFRLLCDSCEDGVRIRRHLQDGRLRTGRRASKRMRADDAAGDAICGGPVALCRAIRPFDDDCGMR